MTKHTSLWQTLLVIVWKCLSYYPLKKISYRLICQSVTSVFSLFNIF